MNSKITSLTPLFVLAAMLAGVSTSATSQTHTRFDGLPNGTFPTEIDSTGRIIGTAREAGAQVPSRVFLRGTDGSISYPDDPASDWRRILGDE